MDTEEKDKGGFQDSHMFRHQYLKMIWIERLLMKFLINLIFPLFSPQLLLFSFVLVLCCE